MGTRKKKNTEVVNVEEAQNVTAEITSPAQTETEDKAQSTEITAETVAETTAEVAQVQNEAAQEQSGVATKEIGKANLVVFEHFVKEGSMTILNTIYEVKDYTVEIRPEHVEFALHHGLKPKK